MVHRKQYVRYIMALGHFCVDFTQGTLSAVLPFLIASYHYSYATAAVLVMVSNLIGSVIQPVFGVIADKVDRPHLVTIGALLAGGGMAAVGFIPSFWGLCIAVIVTGVGVAMLHPQAARMVNRMADESNRGMSMGIFSFGGNAGFTLGPVCAASAVTLLGLKGTLTFLIPAFLFAAVMGLFYRDYEGEEQMAPREEEASGQPADDWWGAFIKLGVLITCRSIIFSGISTFLILFMIEEFSLSKPAGSALLSLYYGIGAISSLVGGKLADLNGLKPVNDIEGHNAGDNLLKRAAQILKDTFPDGEIYRAGGDEFVVVETDKPEESLQARVDKLREKSKEKDCVSFAIGFYHDGSGGDIRKAMHEADVLMYEDKKLHYAHNNRSAQ